MIKVLHKDRAAITPSSLSRHISRMQASHTVDKATSHNHRRRQYMCRSPCSCRLGYALSFRLSRQQPAQKGGGDDCAACLAGACLCCCAEGMIVQPSLLMPGLTASPFQRCAATASSSRCRCCSTCVSLTLAVDSVFSVFIPSYISYIARAFHCISGTIFHTYSIARDVCSDIQHLI